jgi:3-hydroxyisobutyrate dehydrogenase-like beta-hydroxyacid dehydrogenase
LAAEGAHIHETPADAARAADIVLLQCCHDDNASRAAWTGPQGALALRRRGAVLIDSSTITPRWVEELAELAKVVALSFWDAPVTGSKPQAKANSSTFLVGGES